MKTFVIAGAALLFAASAAAQDWPVPKMFKGMEGKPKGQWQMEILEGGGRGAGPGSKMTICTDNLAKQASSPAAKGKSQSNCKHRLLKDTADEAVMESVCGERTSTMTFKRESAKSTLLTMQSTTPKGPQTVKMRYTELGPCREGQGTLSLDPNSEQCQKIKAQAAQMDPAKQCARQKADREACEQRMRDAVAQMKAMCG